MKRCERLEGRDVLVSGRSHDAMTKMGREGGENTRGKKSRIHKKERKKENKNVERWCAIESQLERHYHSVDRM